jgi:hypothetical protein
VSRGPYVAFLLLLVGSGLAHGWFTNRWGTPPRYDRVQAALDAIPEQIDGWRGAAVEMDPDDLIRVGIRASHFRVYRHAGTGKAVTVLLVAGAPGPVSVHTPDVCFRGLGYETLSKPVPADAGGSRFWKMECTRPGAASRNKVFVYWAWNAGAGWEAPEHRQARVKFSLKPVLYKLYLMAEVGEGGAFDPVPEFANAFLRAGGVLATPD